VYGDPSPWPVSVREPGPASYILIQISFKRLLTHAANFVISRFDAYVISAQLSAESIMYNIRMQ
jgi:hypothetical protein